MGQTIKTRIHLPVKFLPEFSCRPGSRLPWNYMHTNKNIAAPFSSLRAPSSWCALLLNISIKNPDIKSGFLCNYRASVTSLLVDPRRSRPRPSCSPFGFQPQTRIRLRLSRPYAFGDPAGAVCLLSAYKLKKPDFRPVFKFIAQRGTRTLKPCGMRPSNARVYQFRHLRENLTNEGFKEHLCDYIYILLKKYAPRN